MSMNDRRISVILPAHNEAGNIEVLLQKVDQAFKALGVDGEAILIDDGSTDGTADVISQARYPFVNLVKHPENQGLTMALKSGFKAATGDVFVFLPTDLQSDPAEDIPKLVAAIDQGADMVVGWRQGRKEFKRWGSKVYNFMSKWLFGVKVHDQNWIKAMRAEVVRDMHFRSDWHRFLVAIAESRGYKVVEVKTNWYERTYGKSHYGLGRISNALFDMMVLKVQMLYLDHPIRFFGGLGLVSMAASLVLLLVYMILSGAASQIFLQRLFIIDVLLFFGGALLLMMGLLVEILITHIDKILAAKNKGE
jgi:glycosyltransferase involved in cell wall biosynthesis